MYKTVALQRMLKGESKRLYETWKLEGLPFENIFTNLKEYARGVRLDDDASKGMQGVNMNWAEVEQGEEDVDEDCQEEHGDINKLSDATC